MDELKIPKLAENNYTAWSIRTRAALVQKNCWEAIDPGFGPELKDEERKLNDRALTFLFLVVNDEYLDDIADCTRAKEAWISLKDVHTKFGLLHTLQLLKELFNITLNSGESMNSYLGRLMDLHRKVSACGYGFTDREVSLIMLMGLPKEYEGLILNLERDENELTSKIVKSRLLVEEKKLVRHSDSRRETNGERALKIEANNKNKNPSLPKKFQKNNEKKTRCFSCGEWGHIARNCAASKSTSHAKMVSDRNFQALCAGAESKNQSSEWILDSGATEHMCSQKEKFIELTPVKSQVEIANAEKIEVAGVGSILLKPTSECSDETFLLANVLYVPKLDSNLLSAGRIEEMGITVCFQDGKAVMRDPKQGKVILTAHRQDRLYKIKEITHKACFSKYEKLMHRRLGHFHKDAIKKLVKEDKPGKEEASDEGNICSTCILGKMKKSPFPKGEAERASRPLELIHSDVAGPIKPTSKGGSKYIVTFIDDYSRYVVVKLMKTKDEVLEKFIEYKNKVENFHGLKITAIRSDNGGEYISEEFEDLLFQNGISRQRTVPRTPEQNGVAEKMNHTLLDMTRCLLIESSIPNELWADAVATACYLRNKCPSKAINGNIPEELWTGKQATTSHLKIFGCRAFSHIDKSQQKGKLGRRSQECVFVGYPEGIKGYKLWNVEDDKFFVSRNVKFDETVFPFSRNQSENQTEEKNELIFSLDDKGLEVNIDTCEDPRDDIAEDTPLEPSVRKSEAPGDCIESDEETSTEKSKPPNEEQQTEARRSNRKRKPKTYYGDPILYKVTSKELPDTNIEKDPANVKEALKTPEAEMWQKAMDEEVENLRRAQTWELVTKPPNTKLITSRWIFRKKKGETEGSVRFKARLVAKGYLQVSGVDFKDTFSPVIKLKSIRVLLAIAAERNLATHQMDITAAYLNGVLEEDIYMAQPEGCIEKEKQHLVCHLKKSIYGLRQSGRVWNTCLNDFLTKYGLKRSNADPCIYYCHSKNLMVGVYVDDLLVIGEIEGIHKFKMSIKERFTAKDLGPANQILSMQIHRAADGSYTLDQTTYVSEILETFNMTECRYATTPLDPSIKYHKVDDQEWEKIKENTKDIPYRQAIGSLLYLTGGTRPDVAYSSTYMSQFNEKHSDEHWKGVKHILRYLKGTQYRKLKFQKTGEPLQVYSDADWGGDRTDRKSYSGYIMILAGAPISWSSKKQSTTALSSTEAEYMAMCHTAKEILWINSLLKEICSEATSSPQRMLVDNQGAIFIAKNHVTSERSKHIDIKYFFLRELVEDQIIAFEHVPSSENLADLLTKQVSKKMLLDTNYGGTYLDKVNYIKNNAT